MEETIKERLTAYLRYKGINKSEFGRIIGVSNAYISSIRKSIQPDKAEKIASSFPDLNIAWLMTGEGEMVKSNTGQDFDDKPQEEVHGTVVPLLPILAHGGKLTDFECSISRYECEKVVSPIDGVDLAITISGDSMAPEYPSGSSVLIKKVNEKAFIEWGKVYVLDTCNGTIIKQLMPHDNPSYVRCVSLNSAYPPFDLSLSYVHAIYRVLLCMAMK